MANKKLSNAFVFIKFKYVIKLVVVINAIHHQTIIQIITIHSGIMIVKGGISIYFSCKRQSIISNAKFK